MALVKIPPRRGKRRQWPKKTVLNPGKGLNTLVSENFIDDAEASDLLNVQFVESGCVQKRFGHTAVGTGLSNNPKGLGAYITAAATPSRYLLTIDGTGLKYLNSTTWTAISGASFTTATNTTFCQAGGDMYIWNGVEAGAKLDSSLTLTRPTTTVSAAFAIYYADKQIAAGVSTQPNRLYISSSTTLSDFTDSTDDATSHPGASVFAGSDSNFLDISKNDGDKITGLSKYQDKLIVFKERSTWSVVFDSSGNPSATLISNSLGCVGHRSIDSVENDVFFLSRKGYYVLGNEPNFSTIVRTNELSARINPVIGTITAANLSNTAAIYSDNKFYSSISTGGTTTNNKCLMYDRRYYAWSVADNLNANAFTEFIDSSNVKHLYYAADDEAEVYEIDETYSDNGDAISSYWVSKAFDMGDMARYKQFLEIEPIFRQVSGTVTITIITDGNMTIKTTSVSNISDVQGTIGSSMWGEGIWGGNTSTAEATSTGTSTVNVPYRIKLTSNNIARTIKIKISNANNNENFVLLGFNIYYRDLGHERFPSSLRIR